MIVAAGLTPAWQQILRFDDLQAGEVNRAVEAVWCASGKVLNVGIALAQLGAKCETIAPLGGWARLAIEEEFRALSIPHRWIPTIAATRVCTTLLDEATRTTTELVENARSLTAEERREFETAYGEMAAQAEVIVLTGSLPVGTPPTFYRDLLARSPGLAVVDARGPELLEALVCEPLIVKPNREELAKTVGRTLESDQELIAAMRELVERGAQWVVITQGKDAVWVASASQAYRLAPLLVEQVVNPIGCGDCLAAGIAWGLAQGKEPLEAVTLGMAAAAQNLSQLLPARVDAQTVAAGAPRVQIERVAM